MTDNVSANAGAYDIFKQGIELERQLLIFSAREKFMDAIAMDSENQGYLTHYGWFLQRHGFYEEAVIIFTKLLPLADDKKAVHPGLAWNLKVIGRPENFPGADGNISKVNDSEGEPTTFFDETARPLNDKNQKIMTLRLKIASTPNPVNLQKSLFNAYADNGEFDNAIQTAEEMRLNNALDRPTQLQFARVLFWHGEKRRSEIEYRELITGSPTSAFLYFELAGVLEDDGRLTEATEALEKSLSIYPDAAESKKKLAEVLARIGRGGEALKVASSIAPGKTSRLTGLLARARVLHFSGQLEDARTAYQVVLAEYPYNVEALWGMTETSIYTGRYKSARLAMARWEDAAPDQRLQGQKKLLAISTAPAVKLQTEYYTNSSDFTRKNSGVEFGVNIPSDLYLNVGYLFSDFEQDGFEDIVRHSMFVQGDKHISNRLQLTSRIAGNKYDNQNTNVNGNLSIRFRQSKKLTTKFSYGHFDIIDTVLPFNNTIHSYVVTIGSVGLDIQSDDYKFYLLYNPLPRVFFSGEFTHGDYSDGNRKSSSVLEAAYQVLQTPYLRAAYNYFHLDFKDPAKLFTEGSRTESAYWDPINFETHSLRLDFNHDYGKQISYGANLALSYIPKSEGLAKAAFLFTSYRFMEKLSLRFDARWVHQDKGVDRVGKSGGFRANNYNATFQYRF